MKIRISRFVHFIAALILVGFCITEAKVHFDSELIELKKQRFSAQKNWNWFFDQSNVYESGSLNVSEDILPLRGVLQNDALLISDLATSYYLAAHLPIRIANVHRHHGRYRNQGVATMLDSGRLCRLSTQNNRDELETAIYDYWPKGQKLAYLVINKSQGNQNFSRDCLSANRGYLISTAKEYFEEVFENEGFLVVRLTSGSI